MKYDTLLNTFQYLYVMYDIENTVGKFSEVLYYSFKQCNEM